MPVSFSGKFKTTKGKWEQVKIPFASFKGGFRGRQLPDTTLNPAMIQQIGIILADKNPGPFQLEIDWIRTYGKGPGRGTGLLNSSKQDDSSKASDRPARLIATLEADRRFTTLKKAFDAADLTVFFQWDNPLTVFAPTDDAFAKLPENILADYLLPENKQKLVSLLSYHVSPGNWDSVKLSNAREIATVNGAPLMVTSSRKKISVGDAKLIESDLECRDGIIHVLNTVLFP